MRISLADDAALENGSRETAPDAGASLPAMAPYAPADASHRRTHGRLRACLAAAAALLVPATSQAMDGIRPRSLVVWNDVPCMTVVDRAVDPVVHIPYGISFEDTAHTLDEVMTGRRHQMIALCRQRSPQAPMPVWLSQADVDDAATVGLVDPADVGLEEILDTMAQWSDCAVRVVADADRRPITAAAAAEGVDWDTTGVAEGGWVIEGYTWDPAFNQWAPRRGVFAIYDDASAPDNPPAAAVITGEVIVAANEVAMIDGCVVAPEGSTMRVDIAEPAPAEAQVWQTFLAEMPVDGTTFSIPFAPPAELVGGSTNLRVEIVDTMGRSYTAYMQDQVTVIPGSGCGPGGGGFLEEPACETTSTGANDTSSGTVSTGDETAATGMQDDPAPQSCGCRSDDARPGVVAGLVVLVLARRRRSTLSSRSARAR
jgi:MYXO-CTERM domain-containing protein